MRQRSGQRRGVQRVLAFACALALVPGAWADTPPAPELETAVIAASLDPGPAPVPDGIEVFTVAGAPLSRQLLVGLGFGVIAGLVFIAMTNGNPRGPCGPGCVVVPPDVPPGGPGVPTHH